MRRLVDRALLALAEGSRQRGEPAVAAPHVAGVRIRAAFDEKARRCERRPVRQIEPGVRHIEERLPVEPPASGIDQRRVGVEHPRHLVARANACGVPDITHGRRWIPHEHSAGPLPEDRPIVVIIQAREVEEVRVVARDELVDVGLQLPPGGESVVARDPLPGEVAGEYERDRLALEGFEGGAGGEEVDGRGRGVLGLIVHVVEAVSPGSQHNYSRLRPHPTFVRSTASRRLSTGVTVGAGYHMPDPICRGSLKGHGHWFAVASR